MPVTGPNAWGFNGDVENPTLDPSILVEYHTYGPDKLSFKEYKGEYPCEKHSNICHSFMRNGYIEFCNDCTHELAGQVVEMPEESDASY